ncbi:lysine-specific histone demethylase 2 isoform X1 [Nothobranchius furzeri]|uniref:[histone-H3]-N(6),N(6)-dimethyl-L-lysine(4) FAD-dependent demethylase n=1 Tax=Nothobranchius furzeri TaxID=105023 RepID=A0A9D2Y157_NOTFU|nr:lysine-specific histone demethylase 2 isoform X1 [Nothobranchius furzeri]KAF7211398.1 transcript variant X1 [Nothobranchius furzeri]
MDGEQRSPKVIKPKRPFPLRNRKWCCCYSDALIFSSFTTTKKETNLFEPFIKKLQTRNKVHKLRHCRAMLSDADYSGNASGTRRAKKRSSEESPGESQTPRISGRQTNARVKRTNNPPPGQSKRKATDTEEEDDQSEKKYRKCEKAGCSATYPVCFASASERCAKNGYTSRWYHLSCGEHFCNECFDHYYRSHKDGYETFASWKRVWTSNGKSEPSLKAFMADQLLPYWVQCSRPDCRKWRQLTKEIQLTTALAATYRCGMKLSNIKMEGPDQCSQPEDLRVAEVTDSWWHSMLILPPLLKESPAGPFLAAYYPDCVGMSPSGSLSTASVTELRADHCRAVQSQSKSVSAGDQTRCVGPGPGMSGRNRYRYLSVPGLCPYFQPFYQPNECGKALCVRPDMMELDELYEFPEFSRDPTMYLALRNLILASWHKNCTEVLTAEKCAEHIIVRGLVRVRCVQELDRVLHFMTRKGLINTGVLAVKRPLLPESFCSKNVIVIGAGAAGLAAARQLQNFGTQVLVLEARERIGGRVWDDVSLGVTVGRGAQIVNGCVNNPIALMCEQMGIRMHKLGERCDLFQEDGKVTDPAIDKRMDFHFNAILDVVSDWRKDKSQGQDSPLGEKVREIKKNFLQESGIQFSELEEKVLQFHLSNLEFACGSSLDQVSARSWDHNEFFAQFSGDHTLLTEGYSPLLRRLAEGLDIRTNCPVQAVDYSGDLVKVSSSGGSQWSAHRVLVSVPLTLLQKNVLRFTPPLPERKLKAIHSLGAGIIEKVALQFPYRFWDTKVQSADYFGHIPPAPEKRGMFSIFYDLDPQGKRAVLMSIVSGEAVPAVRDLEDKQVVDECMKVLRELFTEQEVPEPSSYFVTHWNKDPWSQMSYSFVKTGGSGEAYDVLAEDVQGKVFFAGEATNRHFPQTVTGAYLSGVREASKMVSL